MKYRIAMWALVGFLVVGCWAILGLAIPINQSEPIMWYLARLTCPIVQVGFWLHFGLRIYWVLLANAATYALLGLIFEMLRRAQSRFRTAK